jgi:hypothetical protein
VDGGGVGNRLVTDTLAVEGLDQLESVAAR